MSFNRAYWITTRNKKQLEELLLHKSNNIAYDKEDTPVYFAESDWALKTVKEMYPELEFHSTSNFKSD